MRDRYANKSLPLRIFHKYTGFIVVSIIITIVAIAWWSYESEAVFFESWSCNQILSMRLDVLDAKEYLRYEEIKAECLEDSQFTP